MSHTTTIGQILFADQAALRAAIVELKDRGVDCELLEQVAPRAYYQNQMGVAPLTLKLNNSRYDVGFYPNKDGALEAQCDLWGQDIERELGAPVEEGVTREQAAIGKLRNAYANQVIQNHYASQGGMIDRQENADGSVNLTVRFAA